MRQFSTPGLYLKLAWPVLNFATSRIIANKICHRKFLQKPATGQRWFKKWRFCHLPIVKQLNLFVIVPLIYTITLTYLCETVIKNKKYKELKTHEAFVIYKISKQMKKKSIQKYFFFKAHFLQAVVRKWYGSVACL